MIMARIFKPWLGRTLDNVLDDLLIGTDTLEEHIVVVKTIIDVLEKEKFYVNSKKI